MMMNEAILFRVKNKPQRLLLAIVGFDDDGLKLESPLGKPINGLLLGETLIDPDGNYYIIKKMSIQSNLVWIQKIYDDQNIAS